MEVRMNGYKGWYGWATVLAVILLSFGAGTIAYNVGLSHGIAQGMAAQGTPVPPYAYGWYRPWGFGFGFPLLFFVFVWFAVLRGLWWGGPWRHHRYYAGWHGVAPPPCYGATGSRGHQPMREEPPADDPGRRG
jgi:hypothetical protein